MPDVVVSKEWNDYAQAQREAQSVYDAAIAPFEQAHIEAVNLAQTVFIEVVAAAQADCDAACAPTRKALEAAIDAASVAYKAYVARVGEAYRAKAQ